MKVLVVGGGGREHAIVYKLSQSPRVEELYCAPGNAGIAKLAHCVPIKATDVEGICDFALSRKLDFVVVAPDDPLAAGMVDALEERDIPAFGPKKNAAILEASKSFSKDLMARYHIPTARYRVFDEPQPAVDYIREQGAPIVVKADGLALGKGVIVAKTEDEAVEAVRDMMENGLFGAAGGRVVVEECMTGPEVTVLAFTDGKTVVPMPATQDHKRARDGDQGLNTGGMGAVSHPVAYTPEVAKECMEKIFLPTVRAMAQEGRPFQGVLYFGLMITPEGPKVVEYNARFGDPECQVVLMLLESDLLPILEATRTGTLDQVPVKFRDASGCVVVLASGGYPGKYETGLPIAGLDQVEESGDVQVFHAGTKLIDGAVCTAGGRVLGVTAVRPTLREAVSAAYEAAKPIRFEKMHYRTDIGSKNL